MGAGPGKVLGYKMGLRALVGKPLSLGRGGGQSCAPGDEHAAEATVSAKSPGWGPRDSRVLASVAGVGQSPG